MNSANEKGVTIIELLVVFGLIAILLAAAVTNLSIINSPLADSTLSLNHQLKLMRSRALVKTKTIKLEPVSATIIAVFEGAGCSTATTSVPKYDLTFTKGVTMVDTTWELCFVPRGFASKHTLIELRDHESRTKTVEIARGGAIRVQ